MRSRPVLASLCTPWATRGWALALALGVSAAGCKVYKKDLLEPQTGTAPKDAGPPPDAAPPAVSDSGQPPATNFDPETCVWGDCWWSRGAVDECRSAGVPTPADRPLIADDKPSLPEIYLGFTQMRVGSTNRNGEMTEDAWEDFGFDLDGKCTNSKTCQNVSAIGCKPGAPTLPFDGQLCRDNTLARLQPVIAAVPELGQRFGLGQDIFNCALWRGSYNVIWRLTGYNGELDDPHVRVDYYISTGIEEPVPWKCPTENFHDYPRWRSSRTWGIDQSTLSAPVATAGKLPDSKVYDAEGYVKHGYLVARMPDGSRFGFVGDDNYRGFQFKVAQGLFVGRIFKAQDGTWAMKDGLTAGRIRKEDLVQALREVGICQGGDLDTFYQSVLDYVNENADLLASGEVQPDVACDAMSFAFGFEAAALIPGKGVSVPARLECCPPGKSADDCNAKCGDGKVSGAEKCDTQIEAGQPGACPTSCMPTNACTPQALSGSDCSVECVPMQISMAGAKDGCCPDGANATNDTDCMPKCGNNVVETGETCDPAESCKACTSNNPCLQPRGTGNANTCNLRCDLVPITQCRSSDRCCPAGCSSTNDRDCSSMCGNRVIDAGETCEAGTNMPCPANCDDKNACTADRTTGSAQNCNISCTHTAITQAMAGDGCCPEGASANNDSDCMATCGNGAVEGTEQCDDGNDKAGDGCNKCVKETQAEMCLGTLGLNDACTQCTCNKCASLALNCAGNKDPNEAKLCKDMVQCGRDTGCGNPDCFCGRYSLFTCLTGLADGPCKNQVAAAAKTNSLIDIDARKADNNYPLGRANNFGACVDTNCANECGR